MEADDQTLPNGWVVRQSKSRTGHHYYFNTINGQSSWKHPAHINVGGIKIPKKKQKKCQISKDSSSISSGDVKCTKSNGLLSPASPTASFTSSIKHDKKSALVKPLQQPPKQTILEGKDSKTVDQSLSKQTEQQESPQYGFKCSRNKASHIAKWVDNVNHSYVPSDQSSLSGAASASDIDSVSVQGAKTLGTDWKQQVHTKKIKQKKWNKRKTPISQETDSKDNTVSGKDGEKKTLTRLGSKGPTKSPCIISREKVQTSSVIATQSSNMAVTSPSNTSTHTATSTLSPAGKSLANDTKRGLSATQELTEIQAKKPESTQFTVPSNPPQSKQDNSKTTRPPLKKVNHKNKSAKSLSPSKQTSFTPNFFTPNVQSLSGQHINQELNTDRSSHKAATPPSDLPLQQPQDLQFAAQPTRIVEFQETPMNIDRNVTRFSTPFMQSVLPNDPFSSPIGMSVSVQETPISSKRTKSMDNSHNDHDVIIISDSPQRDDMIDQSHRDSGFDEVIDMDIDNFEDMTQLIKAELQDIRESFHPDLQKIKESEYNVGVSSNAFEDGLYIILDTNVLLSHLKFVSELKDVPMQGIGRPVLIVPWIVMQELDSLKSSRRPTNEENGLSVDTLARQAIRFLYSCFESKHPRIRGQTVDEAGIDLNSILDETNDDRILHCCLVIKRKVSNGEAVLFSNDQNLCNKAMINGVTAFNHQNLVTGLRELAQTKQGSTVALQKNNFKEYYEQLHLQEKLAQRRAKADDILCELKCIIREGLAVAVESEMRSAYDDLWDKIVYIKPPWTMQDLLQILNKHWIAVFGDVLGRRKIDVVKELMKLFDPQKGVPGCIANVTNIIQLSKQLFDAFAIRSSYNGVVTKCLAAIQVLHQKCKECERDSLPRLILPDRSSIAGSLPYIEPCTPTSTNIDENTPSSSDDAASISSSSVQGEINSVISRHPHCEVLSTFEVMWSAVTQFSAQIFNALSYPNPIPASVTENLPKPTRDEAIAFLGQLCRCLSGLVTSLHNVLKIPVDGLKSDPQSLERLILSIGSFTKQIIGQNSQISMEALLFFCQDSNTRSALVQGVSQLDRALAMLQHCASCIV